MSEKDRNSSWMQTVGDAEKSRIHTPQGEVVLLGSGEIGKHFNIRARVLNDVWQLPEAIKPGSFMYEQALSQVLKVKPFFIQRRDLWCN